MVVHPSRRHRSAPTIEGVKTVRESPSKLVLKINRPFWQILAILTFVAMGLIFIVVSLEGGSVADLGGNTVILFLAGLLFFHLGIFGIVDIIGEVVTVDIDKVQKTWRVEKSSLLFPKVYEHRLDELEAAVVEPHKEPKITAFRVSMRLKDGGSVTVVDCSSFRERKEAIADRINGFIANSDQ